MGLIRCLKPKKDYKEWISALIGLIFPDCSITMKLLGFINDTYKVGSIKNIPRQKRSTSSTKFEIAGFEKNMPQGNTWQELLNVSEYKGQLIQIIKQNVLEFVYGISPRFISLIITSIKKNALFCPQDIKLYAFVTTKRQTFVFYFILLKLILML